MDTIKNQGPIEEVVKILQETLAKFSSLKAEAKLALGAKDVNTSNSKMIERAQLIVNLPSNLLGKIEHINPEIRDEIKMQTISWAITAREAIELNLSFALGVLLTHQGDTIHDKNDLEKLIDFINEEKIKES
jgi:hypothetical protein